MGLNVYLYTVVPKGFFPQQDTGQLLGFFRVDQGTSFQATLPKLEALRKVVLADPAVQSMTGYAGGRGGSKHSRQHHSRDTDRSRTLHCHSSSSENGPVQQFGRLLGSGIRDRFASGNGRR